MSKYNRINIEAQENDLATILWDFLVITYKHISCNRSNVIIQQKEMTSDCNIQKTKKKISNYTDLLSVRECGIRKYKLNL